MRQDKAMAGIANILMETALQPANLNATVLWPFWPSSARTYQSQHLINSKLVFFFDEAHALSDAPAVLLEGGSLSAGSVQRGQGFTSLPKTNRYLDKVASQLANHPAYWAFTP